VWIGSIGQGRGGGKPSPDELSDELRDVVCIALVFRSAAFFCIFINRSANQRPGQSVDQSITIF